MVKKASLIYQVLLRHPLPLPRPRQLLPVEAAGGGTHQLRVMLRDIYTINESRNETEDKQKSSNIFFCSALKMIVVLSLQWNLFFFVEWFARPNCRTCIFCFGSNSYLKICISWFRLNHSTSGDTLFCSFLLSLSSGLTISVIYKVDTFKLFRTAENHHEAKIIM